MRINYNLPKKSGTSLEDLGYPDFSDQTDYPLGKVVVHEKKLYKFTEAHEAGEWTGNDVVETSVATEIEYGGCFDPTEMSEVIAATLARHDQEINSIIAAFRSGLPSLRVEELFIGRKLDSYATEGNFYLSGAGAPTMIPQRNGQEYFDTTNKVWYKASYVGAAPTTSAWKIITNA